MPLGKKIKVQSINDVNTYKHPESKSPLRPEVGTQSHFPKKKLKAPKTYRYDSSISPSLEWDTSPAREQTEALIAEILQAESLEKVRAAALKLKAMSQPFLNWTGKAERLSFDVPTLPMFIHERLSTRAIIETVRGHKKGGDQLDLDLFGDPQHSIVDQTLKAYEHRDEWVNRMMLGDSQVVMNSLLEYEGLGGQVQMIYLDPPYGVKFGSNFQPFVRKRDVKHNEDQDMTREPEMVKAYRDTWEMGLHSYLSYLRDRLLSARDLLTTNGSIFVQIGDENVHHVRKLMDEVFGEENFITQFAFKKTGSMSGNFISGIFDTLLWYGKDRSTTKFNTLWVDRTTESINSGFPYVELEDGTTRRLTQKQLSGEHEIPRGRRFQTYPVMSAGESKEGSKPFVFQGRTYHVSKGNHWKVPIDKLESVGKKGRLFPVGNTMTFKRYLDETPFTSLTNAWMDTMESTYAVERYYVVQTATKVIQRCILMTTDPGDLVFDPTCGSGTTAYVAEQWGRRWITCDVSRVPLALARQRLLTATFPYYELKESKRGPAGGFVYERKQNKKGEEVGGIVPHITLKSIANNERPDEDILVDRPATLTGITRVTGAFTLEATIPIPVSTTEQKQDETAEETGSFVDRLLEVLRKTPILQLAGNRTVKFQSIRKSTKSLSLSAEATVGVDNGNGSNGDGSASSQLVAFVFGPENGQIVQRTVYQAAIEACAKNYTHLYVIGFAIDPNARELIENCEEVTGIAATYVQATPDLLMGDLLKNMRSSQIFSVCGLPDVSIQFEDDQYRVALRGLDVFDPITMEPYHRGGDEVPAWFLDTDYNGLCFHVCQAFFPKTGAWDNLKKALKNTHDESVWGHLSGTISTPFEAGKHRQIAVKVIDDRGNELLVVKELP